MEQALAEDIGDPRFIPYIQLHEFEAVLFADAGKIATYYDKHVRGSRAVEGPNWPLCPFARIDRRWPTYGPLEANRFIDSRLRPTRRPPPAQSLPPPSDCPPFAANVPISTLGSEDSKRSARIRCERSLLCQRSIHPCRRPSRCYPCRVPSATPPSRPPRCRRCIWSTIGWATCRRRRWWNWPNCSNWPPPRCRIR